MSEKLQKVSLKKRVNVYSKYGLGVVLIQYVLEFGSRSSWREITDKLEEYVLQKYGVEVHLNDSNVAKYYRSVARDEALIADGDLAESRREIAEQWVRSLRAVYDTIADLRVLLNDAYQNKDASKYSALNRNLQEVIKLLSEIHEGANVQQLVREKMITQMYIILDVIKEYDFPTLKGFHGNRLHLESGNNSISQNLIVETKLGLLEHILNKLPEVSDLFMKQKHLQRAQLLEENNGENQLESSAVTQG